MKMNMNKIMQQVQDAQKKLQDELTHMRVSASALRLARPGTDVGRVAWPKLENPRALE